MRYDSICRFSFVYHVKASAQTKKITKTTKTKKNKKKSAASVAIYKNRMSRTYSTTTKGWYPLVVVSLKSIIKSSYADQIYISKMFSVKIFNYCITIRKKSHKISC